VDWVEARAEAVLSSVPRWVWDGRSLPVPVDDIVDSVYGLQVLEVEDMTSAPGCPPLAEGQSLSGLLLVDEKEIWCNAAEAREWPGRKRFTIAHELGHWCLHKPGQDSLFCRRAVVAADEAEREKGRSERPPLPDAEKEANAFAAAMCMPAELLQYHYRNTTRDFTELCEMFGSSMAAMGKRLHQVVKPTS
jgi:hypothetical protein